MPLFNPQTDMVDLRGKVAVVTGGNRGIGYGTVLHLARAGAKVYLAARDETKANEAIAQLTREGLQPGNGEIVWLKMNLDDPREAKKAAEELMGREKRLDILVNNAGVSLRNGHDKVRGVALNSRHIFNNIRSYLSPFVFTETLLPLMTMTAVKEDESDVRIVNVSSIVHKLTPSPLKLEGIDDLCVEYKGKFMSGFRQYAHSKLLDIMWSKHLQRRLDAADPAVPITVITIHPGGVDTFTDTWPLQWLTKPLVRLAIKSPERGAYTSAFAAAGKIVRDERDKYRGTYLESSPVGRIATPSSDALSEAAGEQLYTLTQLFLAGIGL
ncbi:hypothetical protein PQX77_017564 [Marasmius sp. AFHP31]|nr:hypothetical protein PQX77_017564 [Marasmius sp. AFHP31]